MRKMFFIYPTYIYLKMELLTTFNSASIFGSMVVRLAVCRSLSPLVSTLFHYCFALALLIKCSGFGELYMIIYYLKLHCSMLAMCDRLREDLPGVRHELQVRAVNCLQGNGRLSNL